MTVPVFGVLPTERLVVRRFRDDDAARLTAYRSDPDVARYQGWGQTYSEAQARALIDMMRDRQPGLPGWFQFAVADRTSDVLVGDVALRAFDVRHAELGFTFASAVQGRGYAREATRAVLEYAFGPLALHRVMATVDPRNARAAALLRHLGFRHEGRSIESYFDGEEWLDDDLFALLAREWRAERT